VGRVAFAPGHGTWRVTAPSLKPPGRGNLPTTVTGEGIDDVAALEDLSSRLRGIVPDDRTRLDEFNRKLRLAFVAGAEEQSRDALGRPLDAHELDRVLRRYPGDI
jgi:hypothetical protein